MQLSAEQFQEILDGARRQTSGRQWEKRGKVRLGVRYSVTVRPTFAGSRVPAEPMRAWLRDLSTLGVGLVTPAAMEGEFTIELVNRHRVLRTIPCRVQSCRPLANGQFQVGAHYLD
jgi:hypothetical protein